MKLISQPLPGVSVIQPFCHEDLRGQLIKLFNTDQLTDLGINLSIAEEICSISSAGVIRGMHFQIPPHAHQKIITCINGRVIDVFLDLRANSSTFGKHAAVELSSTNRNILHLPIGFAHGFLALENASIMLYKTDTVYTPESDRGIHYDSFGFEWSTDRALIVSERDQNLPRLDQFETPFQ